MSFLKKFGKVLVKGLGIVLGFGPVVGQLIPGDKDDRVIAKVTDTLDQMSNIVLITEGMLAGIKKATGLDKLNAATPFVEQIIRRSELMSGKEIMDEAKFTAAIRQITGGIADLLNSLKPKGVKTV